MSDKIFLDSNIIVYCYSHSEKKKQEKAKHLTASTDAHISLQVLNECCNVLRKKFQLSFVTIEEIVKDLTANLNIQPLDSNSILHACRIAERYRTSYFDALMIATAIECECKAFYSEDMHDGQMFEKSITVINPFKQS